MYLQHQSILGKLHANLNEDAVLHMYEKTLREIPLFEDVEYSFFRAFAKKLRERYFQKGYVVMKANEVISTMHIIYRGKVSERFIYYAPITAGDVSFLANKEKKLQIIPNEEIPSFER